MEHVAHGAKHPTAFRGDECVANQKQIEQLKNKHVEPSSRSFSIYISELGPWRGRSGRNIFWIFVEHCVHATGGEGYVLAGSPSWLDRPVDSSIYLIVCLSIDVST